MTGPTTLRQQAIKVYKQLIRLSDQYPDPNYNLAGRTRECFRATRRQLETIRDINLWEDEMTKSISKAIFIQKEVEALIFLSRYRELKRRYGDTRHSLD
ncbi:uncharacterized protein VP01_601g3 [Puccinia sorghi]|uniref:Uncharacterized protein n=1 Tax=Puccinia sorghi TaxID=27349 RepID=A0A0L6UI66_9BASI|nr:uncharacterized protein VP01_601g3 [Puccinia sorghi]